MYIVIDARFVTSQPSGVGHYVQGLLDGLFVVDNNNRFTFIVMKKYLNQFARYYKEHIDFWATVISFENHMLGELWRDIYIPYKLFKDDVNIFHCPSVFCPFFKFGKTARVVNVHDLVAFLFPDTIPNMYGLYMKHMLKRAVRHVDFLIAPSRRTKEDLIRFLGADPERIRVIPIAISNRCVKRDIGKDMVNKIKNKFGIHKPFVFWIGNIEPRKNLSMLLDAFSIANRELKGELELVLGGQEGWLCSDLVSRIKKMKDVIVTGYLLEKEKINLYNMAELFVFPSIYEGFGIPILEAMACGLPVITSNREPLTEIAGDAALFVDPCDREGLAEAIVTLYRNSFLRNRLSVCGLSRAALFSPEQMARKTLDLYEEAFYSKARGG